MGRGQMWATSVPQNKHAASGTFWLSQNDGGPRRLASGAGNPQPLHCPAPEPDTCFQHVLWRPFSSPGVFPGNRVAALCLTSHLTLHHASPPSSSHQQIQLTDEMLQLQKAKQLWKTDQVPWNSLSQRGRES